MERLCPCDPLFTHHCLRLAVLLRVFERAFLNQHSHGIEVVGVGFAAEAQRFQRDGSASAKRIEYLGRYAAVGFEDLFSSGFD